MLVTLQMVSSKGGTENKVFEMKNKVFGMQIEVFESAMQTVCGS